MTHPPQQPGSPGSPAAEQRAVQPLHVFFNDACEPGNPYHALLRRQLEKTGVRVSGANPSTFILRDVRAAEKRAGSKVSIVHVHWLSQPMINPSLLRTILKSLTFLLQLALLRLTGKRLIWTAHDLRNHEKTHEWIDRLASGAFARMCNRVIVHCDAALDDLDARFGPWIRARARVVPHGSYEDFYGPIADLRQARDRLGLPHDARVFVFLGNIRPYKGVNELIERFRRIDNPSLRLVIAGRAWDESVNRQVQDRIGTDQRILYKPGFVPVEDVAAYMSAADVAVFPYRDILTSGAVLLAMTFGRPCVAVRKACIKETLDDKGSFLYEPEDDDGLESAMRLATNCAQHELDARGRHNLELAAALGWDRIAARTRTVYVESLG